MTTTTTKVIDTESEWLQFVWNSDDALKVGETYAYREYGVNPDGVYGMYFLPVCITGHAKRGLYGGRVTCSDGINRYSAGTHRGKSRVDQSRRTLYYYKNPNFVQPMKPHVQLSLFDF